MQKKILAISLVLFLSGVVGYPKQESKASSMPPSVPIITAISAETPHAPTEAPQPTTAPSTTIAASAQASAPLSSTPPGTTSSVPAPAATPLAPERLSIPSIGLSKAIVEVGLNRLGEMDVPSGATQHVGWYKGGPLPGEVGNAVIGAHVFAAFADLDRAKVGSEILVAMSDGSTRRFVIESATVHKLSEMSAEELFNGNDARRLNLITCAGSLTPDKSTYTHRLVVSAVAA